MEDIFKYFLIAMWFVVGITCFIIYLAKLKKGKEKEVRYRVIFFTLVLILTLVSVPVLWLGN